MIIDTVTKHEERLRQMEGMLSSFNIFVQVKVICSIKIYVTCMQFLSTEYVGWNMKWIHAALKYSYKYYITLILLMWNVLSNLS